jgi:hypothetical protein
MLVQPHSFLVAMQIPIYTRKKDIDGSPIILVLYVDDMLLAGKRKISLDTLKAHLKSVFCMKES